MLLRPTVFQQQRILAHALPFQHAAGSHGGLEFGPPQASIRHVSLSRWITQSASVASQSLSYPLAQSGGRSLVSVRTYGRVSGVIATHSSAGRSFKLVTAPAFPPYMPSRGFSWPSESVTMPASAVARDDTLGIEIIPQATKSNDEPSQDVPSDPESDDNVPVAAEELQDALSRPPPVNSSYLPLPWRGRLGYVSQVKSRILSDAGPV
jgi:UV DNA damage endonuclease